MSATPILKILRPRVVRDRTGLSIAEIHRRAADGDSFDPPFPRKVRVSERVVGFFEHEIDQYLRALKVRRDREVKDSAV